MSMPCPKCGDEVYREDNYECLCEDQQPCPTCGCDTYNETGRCESALQLTKAKAQIEELETAKCPIMQDTIQRGDLAVKNLELIEERHALQARIDAAVVEYERPHVPTTSALNAMLDRLLGPYTRETGKEMDK